MALSRARLEEKVAALPGGLDSMIGDRGVQLSGGEKQRLAIARAILRKAPLLILDEATSSLDSETEALIQEAIDEVLHDCTALVIAHRLATIRRADWIVTLDRGRVVEQGTLDDLISKKGLFHSLWSLQRF